MTIKTKHFLAQPKPSANWLTPGFKIKISHDSLHLYSIPLNKSPEISGTTAPTAEGLLRTTTRQPGSQPPSSSSQSGSSSAASSRRDSASSATVAQAKTYAGEGTVLTY